MIGKTISHYRIIEKLGEGGMGVVYKAEDTRLERTVALKFLSPHMLGDENDRTRFVHEAKAAASLNHPNICTIHEIDEADGQIFIAMELVDGENLRTRLRPGPLEISDALGIAAQIAEGLSAAHGRGIVHRDIKPANIVVTQNGLAKIMDFGLARRPGGAQLTRAGTTMGTVAYMSPEQARGDTVDHRTDLWSLGVVLYEMLAGKRPFVGDRDQAVIYSILNSAPEGIALSAAGGPAEIERALARALAKNPDARYQTAQSLAVDLKAIRQGPESNRTTELSVEPAPLPAIAVLPFANMSPDAESVYFGDGLAEELANALARFPGLRVAARTSAFQFRGTDADAREIGERLNVGTILEGSVRRVGNQLRVTAQLVSAPDGFQLWSKRYDREMTDIFAVQDEITAAIVSQLKIRLTPESKERIGRRDTGNLDAYSLYLEGRYYWNSLTPEGLKRSRECYERAIEIDPNYAPAHAALSMWHQSVAFWADVPPREAFAKSRAAAKRALEIDETSPLAHNCLAVIYAMYDWDWERAEPEFKRAIELDPSSPFGHLNYAYLLRDQGRHGDALRESGIARRLDPLSTIVTSWAAALSVAAGHTREGISELETIASRDPDAWQPHVWLGQAYIHAGARDQAIASAKQAAEGAPGLAITMAMLACSYYLGGRPADGDRLLRELQEKAEHGYVSPTLLAWVHVARGAVDEAVECAERAYEEHDHWLPATRVNPPGMRFEDPRLASILSKAGRNPPVESRDQTRNDPRLSMPAPAPVVGVADTRQAPSIAVLPFADMSPDGDQEYFCDGMAEEIINELTGVGGLRVIARTSAFSFKDKSEDIREIGRKLDVTSILEGSVRKAGDRIRITAQLINITDGSHVWSERYDRVLEDVFAVQDEIAAAIVEKLRVAMTTGEEDRLAETRKVAPEAHELYLRGRHVLNRGLMTLLYDRKRVDRAIEFFTRATEADPDYAPPYAGLADIYSALCRWITPVGNCEKARQFAVKATELDDGLVEAHVAMGRVLLTTEFDWEGARHEHVRALELNPGSAPAHRAAALYYGWAGEFTQAIVHARRALDLDPLDYGTHLVVMFTVGISRTHRTEAIDFADAAVELFPDDQFFEGSALWHRVAAGVDVEASADEFVRRWPDHEVAGVICAMTGRADEARKVIARLEEKGDEGLHYDKARTYAALGEKEKALSLLERCWEETPRILLQLNSDPELDFLRGEQRFKDLLERSGIPMGELAYLSE